MPCSFVQTQRCDWKGLCRTTRQFLSRELHTIVVTQLDIADTDTSVRSRAHSLPNQTTLFRDSDRVEEVWTHVAGETGSPTETSKKDLLTNKKMPTRRIKRPMPRSHILSSKTSLAKLLKTFKFMAVKIPLLFWWSYAQRKELSQQSFSDATSLASAVFDTSHTILEAQALCSSLG